MMIRSKWTIGSQNAFTPIENIMQKVCAVCAIMPGDVPPAQLPVFTVIVRIMLKKCASIVIRVLQERFEEDKKNC